MVGRSGGDSGEVGGGGEVGAWRDGRKELWFRCEGRMKDGTDDNDVPATIILRKQSRLSVSRRVQVRKSNIYYA